MNKTKISYCTHTWNPIAMRCSPAGPGCANCWHLAMAKRQAANPVLSAEVRAAKAGGAPILNEKELEAPLRLRKPARIAVQFMGDLFHENVRADLIGPVFQVVDDCPQHTFLLLTKRPERMEYYARSWTNWIDKPPKNIWLGTSIENQKTANERIPHLLQTRVAVRWVSAEPIIAEIDLEMVIHRMGGGPGDNLGISWCVAGGEGGPRARPCHLEWIRTLRNQCCAAGIPFMFKQWGEYLPFGQGIFTREWYRKWPNAAPGKPIPYWVRAGKKTAGRLLDGRTWDEYPKEKIAA